MRYKKKESLYVFALLCAILSGCDCWNIGSGFVYDYQTKSPLDSVKVLVYVEGKLWSEMYTDSIGYFYYSTGNTGVCKDLIFELTKNGYLKEVAIDPFDSKLYLKKE